MRLLKKPKTLLEIAALVVVILYTRYAGQQAHIMNDTLIEIRKQTGFAEKSSRGAADAAKAAGDAVTTARDNFARDQRPCTFLLTYLFLCQNRTHRETPPDASRSDIGCSGEFTIPTITERSPAFRLRGELRIFHGANAMRDADAFFSALRPFADADGGGAILPPGGPSAPRPIVPCGEPYRSRTKIHLRGSTPAPLTAEEVAFIFGHDLSIVVVGRFQYRDISGKDLYWTDFCNSTFLSGAINDHAGGRHNEAHEPREPITPTPILDR